MKNRRTIFDWQLTIGLCVVSSWINCVFSRECRSFLTTQNARVLNGFSINGPHNPESSPSAIFYDARPVHHNTNCVRDIVFQHFNAAGGHYWFIEFPSQKGVFILAKLEFSRLPLSLKGLE